MPVNHFNTVYLSQGHLSFFSPHSKLLVCFLLTLPPSPRPKITYSSNCHLSMLGLNRFFTLFPILSFSCQISTHKPTREPLQMSPLPAAPWAEISADFGHLQKGKYLLVVTDEYSRYVVVDILDSISTSVIPRLDKIFAEFDVPVSLKTGNSPPFNNHEFKTYASITGFRHRKIVPL